ncbi:MAG: VOC family protein [Pirellulaceae bacterium]|nr:VOC family protein [Pirellulaceae bacterium]
MVVKAIRHTGIVVSDMQASLHFYRDLLGLEVWADFKDDSQMVGDVTGVPGANIWMIKLKAEDGVSIELLQYLSHPQPVPEPRRAYDVGCNHVALQVDDLDALHEKMLAEGIEFNVAPTISSEGFAKITYCRDPEGVLIELVEIVG